MAAGGRDPRVRHGSLFLRLLANSIESETSSYRGTPCWDYTGPKNGKGYGRLSMRVPGRASPVGKIPHRLMAELVLQRTLHPDQETVEHACGNASCINYLHLSLAARDDNTKDMWARRKGTERHVFPPLIDADLYIVDRFIRALPVLREAPNEEEPF
jgi:hypothetical protein